MPFIARTTIETLKRQVNIYDVVSPVVSTLKKAGSQWRGLSPFSGEKTPSFYINPEKNVWYCYSSGQGGDVIRFVQLHENLTFNEAAEALAERFNVPIEYEGGRGPTREERSLRKELLDMHDEVADFFHRSLLAQNDTAATIREYWVQHRKFPMDVADDFKIGLATPDGRPLVNHLTKKGFSTNAFAQSGLFYMRDGETDPRRARPRFRGRLMIPIRNYQSQVIAFTARQLDITPQDDPSRDAKYVNSPETPLFHKSDIVFNLDRAREAVKKTDRFILVEGQLDAIRCHHCGLKHTIAPQGTAITDGQMTLLKRYTNRIDVILDGDNAGQKGALRMLPIAIKAGHEIRFLPLPEGADPDDLLAERGAEAYTELEANALSEMRFAAKTLLPAGRAASPAQKDAALQEIYAILAECDSEAMQQGYLHEAGQLLGLMDISDRAIHSGFLGFLQKRNRGQRQPQQQPAQTPSNTPLTTSEYDLLSLLFHNEDLGNAVTEVLEDQHIDTSLPAGRLLQRTLAELDEDMWEGPATLEAHLESDDERNLYYALLAQDISIEDPAKSAQHCVRRIIENHANRRIREIEQTIANLPTPSDQYPALQREIIELRKLKSNIPTIRNIPPSA